MSLNIFSVQVLVNIYIHSHYFKLNKVDYIVLNIVLFIVLFICFYKEEETKKTECLRFIWFHTQ